jgi:ketosteroid isomerase-like protein
MSTRAVCLQTLSIVAAGLLAQPLQAKSLPSQKVAGQIRRDVADIVAGINARDLDKATRHDANDIVSMESGRPPSQGLAAERQGLAMVFKYAPSWHLSLIEESVDASGEGDMAVYRSTYNEDSIEDGVPYTHRVHFLADFRRQPDHSYKVIWSAVVALEASHPISSPSPTAP